MTRRFFSASSEHQLGEGNDPMRELRKLGRFPLFDLILGIGLSLILGADDPAATISLFDGKSLEGWHRAETYKGGAVKAEGGTLLLEAGGPMTAVACSRADLPTTDYELTYEARRAKGSDFFAAATFPVGKSFVTLVNGGWGGSVTGLSSLNGSDASENETRQFVKYENDIWYKFRIHVTSAVIRCWVDDKAIFAVNYQDLQVKTRIETRPCQPLGFASYRSEGAIRAIQIRRLKPDEIQSNNQSAER